MLSFKAANNNGFTVTNFKIQENQYTYIICSLQDFIIQNGLRILYCVNSCVHSSGCYRETLAKGVHLSEEDVGRLSGDILEAILVSIMILM